MDLKTYYQKIRDEEAKIVDAFPVVISRETGDGGKDGTKTEVSRRLAAKMIAEGTARLARPEEAKAFLTAQAEAQRTIEQLLEATKVHLSVVPTAELNRLKVAGRAAKD
jgi:hypothetical protein